MNSATCLLRSAKGTPPSLPISILFLQNYGSRRSVVVGRASKPVVCRRWQQTAAAAVTRAKEQDRINGPETTRPAPLVIPTTAPNANIFWKLINRGRGYMTFYKTGLKNVAVNYRAARRIRARIKEEAPPGITSLWKLPPSILSRADFILMRRSEVDVKKIPVFSLTLLVCGEFTPLVVPFLGAIVPLTCRLPDQITSDLKRREERRRYSFRNFDGPQPPDGGVSDPAAPATSRGGGGGGSGETYLQSLAREHLLHISRSLNLHWRRLPESSSSMISFPPTTVLRSRIRRWQRYIETDDNLMRRDGGVDGLIPAEVRIACAERGIDTVRYTDEQLRGTLKSWLRHTQGKDEWGMIPLLMKRPSAWPLLSSSAAPSPSSSSSPSSPSSPSSSSPSPSSSSFQRRSTILPKAATATG